MRRLGCGALFLGAQASAQFCEFVVAGFHACFEFIDLLLQFLLGVAGVGLGFAEAFAVLVALARDAARSMARRNPELALECRAPLSSFLQPATATRVSPQITQTTARFLIRSLPKNRVILRIIRDIAVDGQTCLERVGSILTISWLITIFDEKEIMSTNNPFGAQAKLSTKAGDVSIFKLSKLTELGIGNVDTLPFSIKVMLESCLRNTDNYMVSENDVKNLAGWNAEKTSTGELPFKVARVILQDFTGVPCVVDLAAMRAAMKRAGGDPQKINPLVPVDLVIDHSVQVDDFGNPYAMFNNVKKEFERNLERYEFLKWGQKAFQNFGVVPPSVGIVHQVNLEYLAKVVMVKDGVAMPDSLVGTDSHTTMVNGLGVVGWGVGGIEAEACMLGQPIYMVTPQVVGFKLHGKLPEGATATDLVLTVTQILRSHGVVDKFVEFFGDGLATMSVADRATIANMAPEYGATMGFFPVDEQTLTYLRLTGRSDEQIDLVERYCKEQGLWRQKKSEPKFTEVLELDLGTVVPSVAGPRRPQDRLELRAVKQAFESTLVDVFKKSVGQSATPRLDRWSAEGPVTTSGAGSTGNSSLVDQDAKSASVTEHVKDEKSSAIAALEDQWVKLTHGDVVIAAITSCTNTSNPSVMVAAGLLAKKAVEAGLKVPPYVKTSLAPGSRVVTDYFDKAGLTKYLDQMGFNTVGYGCTTCIGNSGPLPEAIAKAVGVGRSRGRQSVLSGNRNFEGRINPHVKANYLASPPLVVAYALAGSIAVNLVDAYRLGGATKARR